MTLSVFVCVCVCVRVCLCEELKTAKKKKKKLNTTSIVTDLNTVVVACLLGRCGDGQEERRSYTNPDIARKNERREKESGREEL